MTDAPERIWAYNELRSGYTFTAKGPQPHFDHVEYVRADIHAATVARAEKAEAELAKLANPEAVFMNLMFGTMARPSWEQIKHIYAEAREADAALAEAVEALRNYADTYCEHSIYDEVCGHLTDLHCGGCLARATIARLRGDA